MPLSALRTLGRDWSAAGESCGKLISRLNPELAEDARKVTLDRTGGDEQRLGELASQGLSNREIAQTLFVTARTVEGHLTSVFRKLQLHSRNDLRAALAVD